MTITARPVRPIRDQDVVWRDIAGEVVIAQRDNSLIRVLNNTASLIWTLADGTIQTDGIVAEVCSRFEVAPEQARADINEFCQELLEAGLINMKDSSQEV
jgi:hypothetical protein